MKNELLLIPVNIDTERMPLVEAWLDNGGQVKQLSNFWIKPDIGKRRVSIYGNDTFATVLAKVLGRRLIGPRGEMLAELGSKWVKRKVEVLEANNLKSSDFPTMVRPIAPQTSSPELVSNWASSDPNPRQESRANKLLSAEVIRSDCEVRAFVLERGLVDIAYYEGEGDLLMPSRFAEEFLKKFPGVLPRTFVMDMGYNPKIGWFILDFNASWGAGLQNCRPLKVLRCIREATVN